MGRDIYRIIKIKIYAIFSEKRINPSYPIISGYFYYLSNDMQGINSFISKDGASKLENPYALLIQAF
jgi:hypothetical protein